jgi:predicted patatin/cPLA2 family phospholipase
MHGVSRSHQVLRNIAAKARAANSEKSGGEGIVAGLVVQGGAMRGVYSIGAISVLQDFGFSAGIDYAVGSSSGAINASYFAAGQCHDAINGYLEDLPNERFINWWRVKPILDIDYLTDEVIAKRQHLDIAKIVSSTITLKILITDAETGEAVEVDGREAGGKLYEVLRASAAIPLFYNRIVRINERSFLDGGIAEAVPFARAIEWGCSDILVVLTNAPSYREDGMVGLKALLVRIMLRSFSDRVIAKLISPDPTFNQTMRLLEEPGELVEEVRVAVIYPSDPARMVSRTTRNRAALQAAADLGKEDMQRSLREAGVLQV